MLRRFVITCAALCLFAGVASDGAADEATSLDRLGQDMLENLQKFYPVRSTEMGVHAYDHRFTDYSSSSVRDMIKLLTDYEQKLYKYRNADLPVDQRVKYHLLKANADIALHDLKRLEWHERSPLIYVNEIVDGIYLLLISRHAPMEERLVTIMERMRAVPSFLETARKNLRKPPPIWVEAAREALGTALDFYQSVTGELMARFPDRADQILKVSTRAREAMTSFDAHLADIPTGGATDFAIGKDAFDYKLRHEYLLDFDSDSLLRLGESLLVRAQRDYAEYEEFMALDRQNGREDVFMPACFSRQDVLDYYSWEIERVREYLEENDIVTVPEEVASIQVVETPTFLRTMITAIAYQPAGPFNTAQEGRFYVRPIPEDLDSARLAALYRYVHRRGFKGSVVHEAYPGHHLQTQVAGMHPDPVRKWQMNNMAVEGWALYCEEMMYEAGLYGEEDSGQWLAILGGIRFRAARIVADVKLHTGQFTYQQCVDWMIEALEIDTESGRDYIRNQVRLYTHRPTYQMSYLMGKLEILALRDAMAERDGEEFSLSAFHDAVLDEGAIPPALLWKILEL